MLKNLIMNIMNMKLNKLHVNLANYIYINFTVCKINVDSLSCFYKLHVHCTFF